MKAIKIFLIYFVVILLLLAVFPLLLISFSASADGEQTGFSADSLVVAVLSEQGGREKMLLEEYLVGVVSAEMPASFEPEALKAQTIAARTYVYRQIKQPQADNGSAEDITVSADPAVFQAFNNEKQRKEKWRDKAPDYEEKIRQAVGATSGIIVTKDGRPVSTPYSAVCGGHTSSSANVWGGDNSWLQSVVCKWDTEAPKYESQLTLPLQEAASKLSVEAKSLPGMKITMKDNDGRVAEISVGEKTISGQDMRTALELNSTNFSWQIKGDEIIFQVRGYGHGVGLCQYGANGMAKAGYDAEEILRHYYSGVELSKIY